MKRTFFFFFKNPKRYIIKIYFKNWDFNCTKIGGVKFETKIMNEMH